MADQPAAEIPDTMRKILDDQLKRKKLPRPKRKAQMVNDPDLHELADVWKDKANG